MGCPKNPHRNLTKRQKAFAENYVSGMSLSRAAEAAGYGCNAFKHAKQIYDNAVVQEYIKRLQADIIHEAGLSCKWFLERCMTVFNTCSELIDDGKGRGGLKIRDANGAAKMAAIIKDAIPDFKTRFEHTVTEPQVFKIGDQEIKFD